MNDKIPNRWRIASAAVLMQICLGVLYSWAVFRGPLADAYGWSKTDTIAPYRYSTLFFTIAMVIAGFWQDRKGPKVVGSVGGLLLGTGCLLASFVGNTTSGLIVSYGVVAGLGVGFAYVTPIATCIKWFPDKRGMVVGLAVMGFGMGPLVFAPLLETLIGKDAAQFSATIPRTFLIMSGIFFVFVIGAAQFYRLPPVGWKPEGWNPASGSVRQQADYAPLEMVRTWPFYAIWLTYFVGSAVGLTAIGEAAPLIREMAGQSAVLTAGAALGVMSFFNGVGRLAWGSFSDRAGRKATLAAMCALSFLACAFILPGASGFWRVLAGLCVVGFCYGGFLAVIPSMTADFYGPKNIGANYGIVFSAWGAAGFLVPGYFASVIEAARQASRLSEGYQSTYQGLALLALIGGLLAMIGRRPAPKTAIS
jgi:OFA family oxalate/formate antiporter-like MFS transporter